MPRAFLVKNKAHDELDGGPVVPDDEVDAAEDRSKSRMDVIDVVWRMMRGPDEDKRRATNEGLNDSIGEILTPDQNTVHRRGVNETVVPKCRRTTDAPTSSFKIGQQLHRQLHHHYQHHLQLQQQQQQQQLPSAVHNRHLVSEHHHAGHAYKPDHFSRLLQDADFVQALRYATGSRRQQQPAVVVMTPIPSEPPGTSAGNSHRQFSPRAGTSLVVNPSRRPASSLPAFPILPATALADQLVTSSKFNPFVNCAPLTSNVDTNRLYPRINSSTNTGSHRSPTSSSSSSSSSMTSPPTSSSVASPRHLPADYCSIRPSTCDLPPHTIHYVDELMRSTADWHRRYHHLARRSEPPTGVNVVAATAAAPPPCAAAAAATVEFQRYARMMFSDRIATDMNCGTGRRVAYAGRRGGSGDVDAATAAAAVTSTTTMSTASPRRGGSQLHGLAPPTKPAGRYRCPDCPKTYSTVGGLTKHRQFYCRRRHQQSTAASNQSTGGVLRRPPSRPPTAAAAPRDQRCPQCDKSYTSSSALKMHIRTHTLPCRCRMCGKAFSRPWLLQGHLRTHTGEKPFECPHCSRAFADRSNLRAHLQTHYDVKQYQCTVCRRTFSRMSLLIKHRYGPCSASAAANEDDDGSRTGTAMS